MIYPLTIIVKECAELLAVWHDVVIENGRDYSTEVDTEVFVLAPGIDR